MFSLLNTVYAGLYQPPALISGLVGLLSKFNLLRTEGKGPFFIKSPQGTVILCTGKSVAVQATEQSGVATSLSFCIDPQTTLDFQKDP